MSDAAPVTMFGPDFPFAFDDWIAHAAGLGSIPAERHGAKVAIIGAGISGVLMRLRADAHGSAPGALRERQARRAAALATLRGAGRG